MNRASLKRALLIDVAIAATLAVFVLVVAPGLAIVGLVGLLVLIVGGAGLLIELGRARRPELALREDR